MDLSDLYNIELIIFFVAPGFISLKVWGLLNSNPRFRISESLIEAIIFSSFNAIVFLLPFDFLLQKCPILAYIVVCMVLPIIWPILFYRLAKRPFFRVRLTPTAWEHYFNLKEDCFMRLQMKDGKMLGGLFTTRSFASSFPEKPDLYLSELWTLDETGKFIERVKDTKGLLVSFDEVSFIELFEINFEGRDPVPGDPIT